MDARAAFGLAPGSAALALLLLSGCGGGDSPPAAARASASPAVTPAAAEPFSPVDACALLTKAEVEALVGKTVLEPRKEAVANLVTCSYGDPAAPKVGERSLSQVLTLSVFTGQEGAYYAGPAAQAKDAYEQTRKNADSPEAVSGLGDSAYWNKTFHSLEVLKGRCWLSAGVESEAGVEVARKVIGKAIERLP